MTRPESRETKMITQGKIVRCRRSLIYIEERYREMTAAQERSRIAIIGGGLVGALAACFFAKRGHRVIVYEYRSDIRIENSSGQNINLGLSIRGREALRAIGLEEAVVKHHSTAMRGRMIHDERGNLKEILYDSVKGNCIYAIGRRQLNVILLDAAEKYPEVRLDFNKKLVDADLERGKMKFLNTKTDSIEDAEADLIIGADGAYSTVRRLMSKRLLFDYSQRYVEHFYTELKVPAKNNEYAMSSNNLHIWPRKKFLVVALPNKDRTFTSNMFAPLSIFEKLKTPEALLSFYAEQFPDLLRLVGKDNLVKQLLRTEAKTLITIKCKPYHVGKTALVIGDAAHAMVPYYAQGMNSGFEDVLLLDEIMERYDSDFAKVLPEFTELRCDDAHAICDLAMYNYFEVGDLVRKKTFLFRKFVDNILYTLVPRFWIPLYHTVHFTRMGFRDCIINKEWQDRVLRSSLWCFGLLIPSVFFLLFFSVRISCEHNRLSIIINK